VGREACVVHPLVGDDLNVGVQNPSLHMVWGGAACDVHAWVCDDLDIGVQALERLLGVPVGELERKFRLVPCQCEDLRMQQRKGQQL
jgi:hypothetical protein